MSDVDSLIQLLKRTLEKSGGLALSAIQIGVPLRVAIFENSIIDENKVPVDHMINPVIVSVPKKSRRQEGCLSFRNFYISVEAPVDLTAKWQDKSGAWHTGRFLGVNAQAVAHELNHMDGVLMIDRLPPQEKDAALLTFKTGRK
jgi:peptide deformylase